MRRLRQERDRGAVASVLAIVLGLGVLLGMGALVVDVGALYVEREELQSGADAAALALAEACALGRATCAEQTEALRYARGNASDGASATTDPCGRGRPELPACPDTPQDNLTDCLGDPPAQSYVEVRATTELANGGTALPGTFIRTFTGSDRYDGTRVGACARAIWGSPRSAHGLGITFSYCEWSLATAGNNIYTGTGLPTSSSWERTIRLKGRNDGAEPCGQSSNGQDAPGGFGWVDDADDDCHAVVEMGTYGGNTGADAPEGCEAFLSAVSVKTNPVVHLIPVYDTVIGPGSNTTYSLEGFAAFVITGFRLNGKVKDQESWLSNSHACTQNSDRCVYGYFTRALVRTHGEVGGPDLGGSIISLHG